MDFIVGSRRSAVLTRIERSTNFLIIRKLPERYKSEQVCKAIIEALKPYKKSVITIKTICTKRIQYKHHVNTVFGIYTEQN